MENKIKLYRTAFCITQKCTLKCKLCLAFIPYYDNPSNVNFYEAKKTLENYFNVVDSVDVFTITGGEPLLNPDLHLILSETLLYSNQINKSIDFVTNGTLLIPENVLQLFSRNKTIIRIVISDYGDLSSKINEVKKQLDYFNIQYRVSNFHGDNLYYDGWIDFRDHKKKREEGSERDEHGQHCLHKRDNYFVINDGELHNCSRSYWRIKNNIIEKKEGEYVPINASISIKHKREALNKMLTNKSVTSCGYCIGLRNDVSRKYPAIQLKLGD